MRALLLAGVASIAIAVASSPAQAQLFCSLTVANEQCALQVIVGGNNNTQDFDQTNDNHLDEDPDFGDNLTWAFGLNLVVDGNGNNQYFKQSQSVSGEELRDGGPIQSQLAANVAWDADDNTQSIEQTATYYNDDNIDEESQVQTAVNVVVDGNGNTQTGSQTSHMNIDD